MRKATQLLFTILVAGILVLSCTAKKEVGSTCVATLPYGPLEFNTVEIIEPGWARVTRDGLEGYIQLSSVVCKSWH